MLFCVLLALTVCIKAFRIRKINHSGCAATCSDCMMIKFHVVSVRSSITIMTSSQSLQSVQVLLTDMTDIEPSR